MSDIVLSKGIRGNLLSLMNTADLRDRTQNRLSTGKRVNNALDNPTNFFSAAQLNSRAADISNLIDGIGNAIKTIEAADNGVRAIVKVVENMQALARQALGSAATTGRIMSTAANDGGVPPVTFPLRADTNLSTSALGFAVGETITISDGTDTTTITVDAGTTVQSLVDQINLGTAKARATITSDGRLLVESATTAAVTVGGTGPVDRLGFGAGNNTSVAGALNGTRANIANQFSELMRQIGGIAKDASFNGVNLLDADTLQVVFNEKQSSSISITGVRFSTDKDLAINDPVNSFQTDRDINNALGDLAGAMAKLRAQSTQFGSNLSLVQIRQKFTQEMVNTLKGGADNLTLADMNEEGANMLSLQTRQQLSTQALSLANQADQGVLRLFG